MPGSSRTRLLGALQPSLGGAATINAAGVATGEAFGSHTLQAAISPAGITTGEAFGAPTVDTSGQVNAAGIATSEAFGQPDLSPLLAAAGVATAESAGSPRLDLQIQPAGIATGEAFGQPVTFRPGDIIATGVESAFQAGRPTLSGQPFEDTPVSPDRFRWRQAPARGWLSTHAGTRPAPGSGRVQ